MQDGFLSTIQRSLRGRGRVRDFWPKIVDIVRVHTPHTVVQICVHRRGREISRGSRSWLYGLRIMSALRVSCVHSVSRETVLRPKRVFQFSVTLSKVYEKGKNSLIGRQLPSIKWSQQRYSSIDLYALYSRILP